MWSSRSTGRSTMRTNATTPGASPTGTSSNAGIVTAKGSGTSRARATPLGGMATAIWSVMQTNRHVSPASCIACTSNTACDYVHYDGSASAQPKICSTMTITSSGHSVYCCELSIWFGLADATTGKSCTKDRVPERGCNGARMEPFTTKTVGQQARLCAATGRHKQSLTSTGSTWT